MPEPQASAMDATTLPASPPARPASLEEAKREAQRLKFSTVGELGWAPKLRERFGYFTPNEVYEGLVLSLVRARTNSVVPGILIHALNNVVFVLAVYASFSGAA